MDFWNTVAGREFTEMTLIHLQTIAECLEVIANCIMEKQDKENKENKEREE